MSDQNYIGCDVGITGGICLLSSMGKIIDKCAMPIQKTGKGNEIDVRGVKTFLRNASPDFFTFVIEEPGGSQSASAAASLGRSFGALRALASLMEYKLVRITPQSWQKPFLKCKAGDTKKAALTMARQLWPDEDWRESDRCKVAHDGIVDACLIAEWARRERL